MSSFRAPRQLEMRLLLLPANLCPRRDCEVGGRRGRRGPDGALPVLRNRLGDRLGIRVFDHQRFPVAYASALVWVSPVGCLDSGNDRHVVRLSLRDIAASELRLWMTSVPIKRETPLPQFPNRSTIVE
jgi:hypothetical protein